MFENLQPNDLNAWQLNETKDGLIYKPTEDLKRAYEALFLNIFPELNLDTSTPQGQLIEDLVAKDTQTLALINDIVNSFFNGGQGRWLDNTNYLNYRLIRKKNIPSFAIVTVEGKKGTVIQKGFTVSDGEQSFVYEGAQVDIGEDGYIDIQMTGGDVQVKANTLTNILTPMQGIYRVNNKSQSTEPTPLESDTSFYKRALQYGAISNSATLFSMISYILNVDSVEKCIGYENPTNKSIKYKGTVFDPHSFGLVIKGGAEYDIAKAIQDKKAPGPAMMGDTSIEIPDPLEQKIMYIYSFFRPNPTSIQFKINVKLFNNTPSTYKDRIIESLVTYIQKLEIASTITQGECICEVLKITNDDFEITDLQLSKLDGALGYSPIELNFTDEAYVSPDNINIISTLADINKNSVYSKNLKNSESH